MPKRRAASMRRMTAPKFKQRIGRAITSKPKAMPRKPRRS